MEPSAREDGQKDRSADPPREKGGPDPEGLPGPPEESPSSDEMGFSGEGGRVSPPLRIGIPGTPFRSSVLVHRACPFAAKSVVGF